MVVHVVAAQGPVSRARPATFRLVGQTKRPLGRGLQEVLGTRALGRLHLSDALAGRVRRGSADQIPGPRAQPRARLWTRRPV